MELIKLTDTAILPKYQSKGAAGLDLHADIKKVTRINPEHHLIVPTGIAVHINHDYYVGKIYTRSGNGFKHGIVLRNGTGIIDSDYQGQIMVCLYNTSMHDFYIEPGDRIAQIIFQVIDRVVFNVVTEFSVTSKRGLKGFGSTGIS